MEESQRDTLRAISLKHDCAQTHLNLALSPAKAGQIDWSIPRFHCRDAACSFRTVSTPLSCPRLSTSAPGSGKGTLPFTARARAAPQFGGAGGLRFVMVCDRPRSGWRHHYRHWSAALGHFVDWEFEPVTRLRTDQSWLPRACGQNHLLLRELPTDAMPAPPGKKQRGRSAPNSSYQKQLAETEGFMDEQKSG